MSLSQKSLKRLAEAIDPLDYRAEAEQDGARVRNEIEESYHPTGILARLFARRSAETK
jgi:hypothetical protein